MLALGEQVVYYLVNDRRVYIWRGLGGAYKLEYTREGGALQAVHRLFGVEYLRLSTLKAYPYVFPRIIGICRVGGYLTRTDDEELAA